MDQAVCLSSEELAAVVLGQLTSAAAPAAEQHLLGCAQCTAAAARMATDNLPPDSLLEAVRGASTVFKNLEARRSQNEGLVRRMQGVVGEQWSTLRSSLEVTADLPSAGADKPHPGTIYQTLVNLMAPARSPDELGRLGEYRVLRVLGMGGMGAVFEAEDARLRRKVALKVIRPHLRQNHSIAVRFFDEARAAGSLRNDHIIAVYVCGEEAGLPFLVMPLLRGETLKCRLEAQKSLATLELVRIGAEIADGLGAAHRAGLVHRDLKPSNIWLDADHGGRVVILDFGVAHLPDRPSDLTETGSILGTLEYMAPEQAVGQQIDARADLFSLGCVLYQMATGVSPFRRANFAAGIVAIVSETPTSPEELRADLPASLVELIRELLNKNPERRPPSAEAVKERLLGMPTLEVSIEREGQQGEEPRVKNAPSDAVAAAISQGQTDPPTTARTKPDRARKIWLARFVGAMLIGGLIMAAVFVLRLTTDMGELIIESSEPGIQITVKRSDENTKELELRQGKNVTRLRSGQYEIELTVPHDELRIDTRRITLERAGRAVVKITRVIKEDAPSEHRADAPVAPLNAVLAKATWKPGSAEKVLPGFIDRPAKFPGIRRWQIDTRLTRMGGGSVAWSSKNQIACSSFGRIHIYDAESLQLRAVVPRRSNMYYMAWSPDGEILVVTGDGTIEARRSDGSPIWTERLDTLRALDWDPSGERLAVIAATSTSVQIRTADGAVERTLEGGKSGLDRVAWSPDGECIAASDTAGQIYLWSPTGTAGPVIETPDKLPALDLSWDSTSKFLAGACGTRLCIWNRDGELVGELRTDINLFASVAWRPNELALVAGIDNSTGLYRFQPQKGGEGKLELVQRPLVRDYRFGAYRTKWAPHGREFATVGRKGVIVWRADGVPRAKLGHHETLTCGPKESSLCTFAYGDRNNRVRLWAPDGKLLSTVVEPAGDFTSIRWSPDGKFIHAIDTGGFGRIIAADGRAVRSDVGGAFAWHPDGNSFVTFAYGACRISHANDTTVNHELPNFKGAQLGNFSWSPDGKLLGILWQIPSGENSPAGHIEIWRTDDLSQPLHSWPIAEDYPVNFAFSPDGANLAVATDTGKRKRGVVRLFGLDGSAGQVIGEREGTTSLSNLAWSAGGNCVTFSQTTEGSFWLYKTSGERVAACGGETDRVYQLTWLATSNLIVSLNDGHYLRYWDGTTGEPRGMSIPFSDGSYPATFSTAGEMLAGDREAAERELVYLIEQDDGRLELLKPSQFLARVGALPRQAVEPD